jgi:hypothetical protein
MRMFVCCVVTSQRNDFQSTVFVLEMLRPNFKENNSLSQTPFCYKGERESGKGFTFIEMVSLMNGSGASSAVMRVQ